MSASEGSDAEGSDFEIQVNSEADDVPAGAGAGAATAATVCAHAR